MLNIEKDTFIEKFVKLPGAFVLLFVLLVFLPLFSVLPKAILVPTLLAFSVPMFLMFFASVLFNKRIKIRSGGLLALFISYVLYMVSVYPFEAVQYYFYSFFFLFGTFFGIMTYAVYYSFYWLGKRYFREWSYRKIFVFSFLPAMGVMVVVSLLLYVFFGTVLFELEGLL